MTSLFRLCVPAALLLAPRLVPAQQPAEAFAAAERRFARLGAESTLKQAFLTCSADSGVVFQNGRPLLTRQAWERAPDQASGPRLIWGPAVADAARSGDLGYTTGPFWLEQPDGQRVGQGQYFTVWARQPDGSLKFLADMGIFHPAPAPARLPEQVRYAQLPARTSPARRADLLQLEQQLSAAVEKNGMAAGYAGLLSTESRLHREGLTPLTTAAGQQQQLQTEPVLRFTPRGSRVSSAGELGYVFGRYQAPERAEVQGSYVHVWKHEARGWRLVAEVLNPTLPPKPKP
ncbi:hypothetical protein [Hymenobacter sp. B81]|uniref:hypothetical protein n=1 Tax=Hymenobacter sp. B81 TaxID=3344878 RepID=UPI0037DD88DE